MQKRKHYIQPTVEIYPLELTMSILGDSEKKRTGYAIDNNDADDSNIIPISEQGGSLWDEDFVEID
ncbi:MAG: hypothetical protein J5548_06585 [Prevotella sp.]|nr:hypothetical protein [Prevotella sp.]